MRSPLKWHGGKSYLATTIVALMPPHTHYVEPFAGGLSVLLAKDPEGVSEVANDLDSGLTNFWRVLARDDWFNDFCRRAEAVPFGEPAWKWAVEYGDVSGRVTPVPDAVAFFVRCRQSMAGRMRDFATLSRNRTRRGMNEQAAAWLSAVEGLPEVHARLKRVVVLNRDALDVIRQQDGPNTLFYCDPPYLPDTRTAPEVYGHEMTAEQHRELLRCLLAREARVLVSGYPSEMYRDLLEGAGWHRTDFEIPNHAAGGESKRRMTECVWTNYHPTGVTGA